MQQWRNDEKPREKLLQKGAASLSDAELVAIFLRIGTKGKNVIELARELLHQFGSLRSLLNAAPEELCAFKGLGTAKYVQLHAALEIGQRYLRENLTKGEFLTSATNTKLFLLNKLRDQTDEIFAAIFLDNKHRFIEFEEIARGSINYSAVYPRTLVRRALYHNAAAIILAHNHPSGDPQPSSDDRNVTKQLKNAMALIEVRILDHLIIGDGKIASLAEMGMI